MSRVFWDAMLFIYLLEGHAKYAPVVKELLKKSRERGDILLTSHLSLGEALVGTPSDSMEAEVLREAMVNMGFTFLPFDGAAVEPFRRLRTDFKLKQPDSMHLACAAAGKVDLFLTNDKDLIKKKLHIPGIHFIVGLEHAPL